MTRTFAFVAALLFAVISVSSACIAGPLPDSWSFELKPSLHDTSSLQLAMWQSGHDRRNNVSASSYAIRELVGLDYRAFIANGASPIAFAVVREAGRIDCAGSGGNRLVAGRCRFTPDAAFSDYLASHGIARPTRDEAFGLTMTRASRSLIEALAAAKYPRPDIDQLTALSALDVSGRYIAELAAGGFRPGTIDELTQFAALKITPDYVEGLKRAGYPRMKASEIVEFKALDITPAYIASFARAGFPNLDIDTLVELKALNVTPDFIRSLKAHGLHPRTADQLVKLKIGLGE
ncbi:MAG: hypothetical protein ABIW33_05455 [Sphingomicrobium sp.]